jgi:hydroxylamine dehydrogenase
MKKVIPFAVVLVLIPCVAFTQQTTPMSPETRLCIGCHSSVHPGIVQDWMKSRHAKTTPAEALSKPNLERRISTLRVEDRLKDSAVGCYECHSLNAAGHRDNFDHHGRKIHIVVSPRDCSTCHPTEEGQYRESKKAHAVGNLDQNPAYSLLVSTVIGVKGVDGKFKITALKPSDLTKMETCYSCHGTEVRVDGTMQVPSKFGAIRIPRLVNWPNQGVGRINPDGSRGACTSCHPRHAFSIDVARKPHTCGQCHLEPDVPGYNVYNESKHGNIFHSKHSEWNFQSVPWKLGLDFQAPTCSTCHNSLVATPDGKPIVERNHDFGARLWVRLFGLIYSHPQPKSGDTSIIRNKDGLSLPTAFTGEPATGFLISREEQSHRQETVKGMCRGCHGAQWTDNHFTKMDNTLQETDQMILASTKLLNGAWQKKLADRKNPFDESIEHLWVRQWLFYGNSVKYASAMSGAPDYTSFKYGWWELTTNLQKMKDRVRSSPGRKNP